jgi:isochorismate synthase
MAITTESFILDYSKVVTLFEEGVNRAAKLGRAILVSYSQRVPEADPLHFFAERQRAGLSAFYWERPAEKFSIAGASTAYQIRETGETRFDQAEARWNALLEDAVVSNLDEWGVGPMLAGGFSFDPTRPATGLWHNYDDALLVLPRLQLTRKDGQTFVTLNTLVDAEAEAELLAEQAIHLYRQPSVFPSTSEANSLQLEDVRPAAEWKNLVAQAVANIKAGIFKKVVLAREVRVTPRNPFETGAVLERLCRNFPDATIFAFAQAGRTFLGATPERLVQLEAGEVRTAALAGSIARGATPEEDAELGEELLNSSKNQGEHAVVIDIIHAALKKVCVSLYTSEPPRLLKLRNVQHLYTPIIGRLRERNTTILKLVGALHPTPALGGYPRAESLAFIRENEGLDRGWYGAPFGWLNAKGEGEFVVAIRSALLDETGATLFAGCGIVADSEPESEYNESCVKLRAMLSALEG